MPDKLCPSCQSWLCGDTDAFCGQCGRPCPNLRLEAFPSVVFVGHRPPDVLFRLTNPSVARVQVEALQPPSWIEWIHPPQGTIAPGDKALFTARINTRTLTEPVAGNVALRTNAGTVSIPLLAIDPIPELTPTLGPIEFWLDDTSPTRTVTVLAAPTAGSLRILSLGKTDQRWFRVNPLPEPVMTSAARHLQISAEIDAAGLMRSRPTLGSRHAAAIELNYEGPHGPAVTPLHVLLTVCKRPAMTWQEEYAPPARLVAMARQELKFTVANISQEDGGLRNGVLNIEALSLCAPKGIECTIHPNFATPAKINGGDSHSCAFTLNLKAVPPKLLHFDFEIRSNGPNPKQSFRVPINVSAVPDFDGIMAIDFGTSNTCCALLETGGSERDIESVPIDDLRTTCPTLVRYLDLDGPLPEIETGAAIKHLSAASDDVAASTVDRLKQQLGEDTCLISVRPKNSQDWRQREVRSAASDYLRLIRESAEWKKQARFTDFVITHPAVCSLQQYRNLRLAIEDAFGANIRNIDFLQEPVAALIPFFAEQASRPDPPSHYTVASFDLGGGTTDITLVRVIHKPDKAGNLEIIPEIVTSWGERFGGEDLTDFLVGELTTRCTAILQRGRPGFKLADRTVKGSSSPDILRNRAALREGAELFKAGLSNEAAAGRDPFRGLLLRTVCAENEQPIQDVRFESQDLDAVDRASLEVVFLNFVRTRVSQLALRMKHSAECLPSLDYIQLSGKTTFLPVVTQVIEQHFAAELSPAADPKECVVRGACLARAMGRPGRSRWLNLSSASRRTTSSIGFLDEDSQMFHAIIPLDSAIPSEGLERDLPGAVVGNVPVVLWENLGFELERIRYDGSRNPLLSKLGIWVTPPGAVLGKDERYNVRLRLTTKFILEITLFIPGGQIIPLKRSETQGGVR